MFVYASETPFLSSSRRFWTMFLCVKKLHPIGKINLKQVITTKNLFLNTKALLSQTDKRAFFIIIKLKRKYLKSNKLYSQTKPSGRKRYCSYLIISSVENILRIDIYSHFFDRLTYSKIIYPI